jgi:hypothetical protein
LWSVVASAGYAAGTGQVIQHNGTTWAIPAAGTVATSVSAGQDGTVIHVQPNTGSMYRWNGSGWSALGSVPTQLQQVSLGGTNDVWVRDTNNNVYRYDPPSNTFTLSATVGQTAHIAATGDGTLWHARSNDANAYRLLAGQNALQPAIPVQKGIVTSVRRVTGTGFGTAYCLAQAGTSFNLYRYDSPYVFKSQYGYSPIPGSTLVEALGAVYFTNALDFNGDNYPVVALDAHTGVVRSQSAPVSNPFTTTGYTPPVFDPVNELIYVGVTQSYDSDINNIGPGRIIALDAHDLSRVVWAYDTAGFVDAGLTVIGTTLLAGDRRGNLYVFDTAAAATNPSQAAPTATVSLPLAVGRPPQADAWVVSKSVAVNQSYFLILWALNEAAFFLIQVDPSATPPNAIAAQIQTILPALSGVPWLQTTLAAPPIVINTADGSPTFAINTINAVVLVQPSGQVTKGFALPSGSLVYGGLTLDTDNGQLWFGDNTNTLYCLDGQLRAVNYTPFSVSSDDAVPILSTPILYRDTAGGKTIFTGVLESADVGYLYGFDPDNGNLVSLPVGDTQITAFSQGMTNGVLYAGGVATTGTTSLSQLFGLRVDNLVQGERDFIIESQLMQDPDQTATNGSANPDDPIPPSVARYQTHISVVDDQKTPRINEPVKIWADAPGTVITIEGVQYTIGPGDAEFAQTQTGPDGTVVIMTDATDVNASALRAWASFMDPYERIVIYPDHEWHGRVSASYNDPTASVTQPDPTRPNLSTVHTYSADPATNAPKQLFTDAEKTDQYPAAMASAIAQMRSGLNPGSSSAATLAGSLKTRRATDAAAAYIAYSDLGGLHYAPNNALAQRTATTVAPFGLMWDTDDSGNATLSILSHSDAADEIDAITGTPWTPSAGALDFGAAQADGVLRVHSWGSFWHHVRDAVEKAGAKIKKVVVSAADKIKAAIAYVVNGVTTFFKTVIEVVEDVVESIGAIFLQLGKLIEDVIEALSLLFHFGEIMKTHGWMRSQITAILGQIVSTINDSVQQGLNDFFNTGGQHIRTSFENIRQSLGINDDTQINDLSNARSTAHTVFKAGEGSAGPNSSGASQAVPAMHSLQKFKSALPLAKVSLPFAATRPGAAGGSPTIQPSDAGALATFITKFVSDVQSDPNLNAALGALTSAIGRLVAPTSAGDFFKSALDALLSVVEALIESAITLSQALVSGLFSVLSALVSVATDLLNAPINIPFFSWLYKTLFGEDLTLINLITLVAAIPVTLIYRIAAGRYPSEDGITGAQSTQPQRGQGPAVTADVMKKIQSCFGCVFAFGLGMARTIADLEAPEPETGVLVCVLLFGVGYAVNYFPLFIPGASPTLDQWEAWAFGVVMTMFGLLPLIPVFEDDPPAQAAWKALQIAMQVCMAVGRFALYIVIFVTGSNFNFLTDLLFARNLMLELGPMFAWLKTLQGSALWVLAAIDQLTMCYAVPAINLITGWASGDAGPLPRRLFFPWVTHNPPPTQAHP